MKVRSLHLTILVPSMLIIMQVYQKLFQVISIETKKQNFLKTITPQQSIKMQSSEHALSFPELRKKRTQEIKNPRIKGLVTQSN